MGQWPAGILAERIGAKAMMIGGLVVAAVASITFIIPLPIEWLIVLRVVQGFGFAAVIPALDAVADRRAEAQGIVGTALSTATAVGSLVGGALFALGVAIPFVASAGAGIVFALAAVPWMLSAGARQPVPEGESA
ncbi:MAG: MFS transporter [Chloroflexi bacterium]|nr:MAG: MFS transporter [Chloroflexota bacterium]